MINESMFTSKSAEYETPWTFFKRLDDVFHFTLDVCATEKNKKCEKFFSKEDNGLIRSWAGERCWMNPPYGREIGKWVGKAYAESVSSMDAGKEPAMVLCLLPARIDTKWAHTYINNSIICFLSGRLKFINRAFPFNKEDDKFKLSCAPFPSMLVLFTGVEFDGPKVFFGIENFLGYILKIKKIAGISK